MASIVAMMNDNADVNCDRNDISQIIVKAVIALKC